MGFNCCEIWRAARIAGQPEWRPIGFHMTSITDREEKVNSHYPSFYTHDGYMCYCSHRKREQ